MYNPENQYRCTIIRGKSQSDMEDLLPLYANMVHKLCPCEEHAFKESSRRIISKALFNTNAYSEMSSGNQKTVDNHLTEIAGTLLGLYYPEEDETGTFIYESESCHYLVERNDYPTFFKNLCLNFQFPNGAKWTQNVKEDISNNLNIKPFCFVVSLLYYAQNQPEKVKLTKQEIGYYVLNNLDALQGMATYQEIYDRIISDRRNGIKREKLSGSREWQHIKEQFNLLELANVIETDATYLWLNKQESSAIKLFLKQSPNIGFDCYKYNLETTENTKLYFNAWKKYYGQFHKDLLNVTTTFDSTNIVIVDQDELRSHGGATKTSVDLGDDGEALVFKYEQERVRKYKERLVNKVLLLGKTKGLGYDISSIEADENPLKPEFARYIEVKSTKRVTTPKFDKQWSDSLNLTAKEWIAAEQYQEYYNIYRVYFTKNNTIIVRIKNPYKLAEQGDIEVYPTIYQMNFDANVIEIKYDK